MSDWVVRLLPWEVDGEGADDYVGEVLLSRCTSCTNRINLSELFASAFTIHRALVPVLASSLPITRIDLSVNRIQDWQLLSQALRTATGLEYLDVSNTELRTSGLRVLVDTLMGLKRFEVLVCSDNFLDELAAGPLLSLVQSGLQVLRLPHNQVSVSELLGGIAAGQHVLKELDVRFNREGGKELAWLPLVCQLDSLAMDVAKASQLEVWERALQSPACTLTSLTLTCPPPSLFPTLSCLHRLRAIGLHGCGLSPTDIELLLRGASCTRLSLHQNQLSSSAALVLATTAPLQVQHLDISQNLGFDDAATAALAALVTTVQCQLLGTLVLHDNGITESGLRSLLAAMKHPNARIAHLDFKFHDTLAPARENGTEMAVFAVNNNLKAAAGCLTLRSAKLPCAIARLPKELIQLMALCLVEEEE
ncbi:hypothetical protein BASA81_004419 [Batrachochytrium salamandrivorans]|nr:hypothetical protein BASA81_004419 [Batrachochytrium salamandrivorans]